MKKVISIWQKLESETLNSNFSQVTIDFFLMPFSKSDL
jgi:hypothetical protein